MRSTPYRLMQAAKLIGYIYVMQWGTSLECNKKFPIIVLSLAAILVTAVCQLSFNC